METPVDYRIDKPLSHQSNQEQILNSSYFKVVTSLAQASLVGGLIEPEEIADHSINLTDQLIAKVSQKLDPDSTTKP